jgi:hypothetical protein
VKKLIGLSALSIILGGAPPLAAQQKPATPGEVSQRAVGEQIPLKVQLVVSRHLGEKKISSIPYTLSVVANDNDKTSMRMGVDVPVPQTIFKGGDNPSVSIPQTSFNYRSVGTNIDCSARTVDGGFFKLDLAVSDTAVFVTEKGSTSAAPTLAGVPSFRSFASEFNLLLKDGQTATHIAATDPVSGEVLRVDVTLSVLK